MAQTINDWVASSVKDYKDKPVGWLSQYHFFRDPARPNYQDTNYFFAPADGIILYQKKVNPSEALVEIKGKNYTLQEAMQDASFEEECYVIGIFMTFYDVHINRIPLPGFLTYQTKEPIESYNAPMLDVENYLIDDRLVRLSEAKYLFTNERMVNKIFAPTLSQYYYILQLADYDVDTIIPYATKQNKYYRQNQRFSQIRYGSQVDLIVPVSKKFDFQFLQKKGMHVEAGVDPLIKICER